MHVFIDDSGDAGFKFGSGSSRYLVMAAAIFPDPQRIEALAADIAAYRAQCRHTREFKHNKTKDRVRAGYLDVVAPHPFYVRAIVMDKTLLHSEKLRSKGNTLKAYAIRQLLTKNFGMIRDAKVVIDGDDLRGFDVPDEHYLMRMVNQNAPGTIRQVRFDDSKRNEGLQLADMMAGCIYHREVGAKPTAQTDFEKMCFKTWQRNGGTIWRYR